MRNGQNGVKERVGGGLYGRRTATARAPNLFDRSRRDGGILCVCFVFLGLHSDFFFLSLGICGIVFVYAGDARGWFMRGRSRKWGPGPPFDQQSDRMQSQRDQWSFYCRRRSGSHHYKATLGLFVDMEAR